MIDRFTEDVRGIIIGGDYHTRAAVFYDGRPQSGNIFAASEADAISQANEYIRKAISKASPTCYADKSLWEIRIY